MELAVWTETVFGPLRQGADEVFVGDLGELEGLHIEVERGSHTDLDIVAAG